jgi:hypothetical protein
LSWSNSLDLSGKPLHIGNRPTFPPSMPSDMCVRRYCGIDKSKFFS